MGEKNDKKIILIFLLQIITKIQQKNKINQINVFISNKNFTGILYNKSNCTSLFFKSFISPQIFDTDTGVQIREFSDLHC